MLEDKNLHYLSTQHYSLSFLPPSYNSNVLISATSSASRLLSQATISSRATSEILSETKDVNRLSSFVNVHFRRDVRFSKNHSFSRSLNHIYVPAPRSFRRCANILMSNLPRRASHVDRTNDGDAGRNPNLIHSRAPLSQPTPFVPA